MEAQDQNESYFLKKQKTIEMDSKIARSRKINECRMSKMKLRHEFVERVQ
jgi:V-type H+-transporting ATPase subunit E